MLTQVDQQSHSARRPDILAVGKQCSLICSKAIVTYFAPNPIQVYLQTSSNRESASIVHMQTSVYWDNLLLKLIAAYYLNQNTLLEQ